MVRFVVMASGRSTRMGQDKLPLPWGNTTVLGHVLQTVFRSLSSPVLSSVGDQGLDVQVWVVARKPLQKYLGSEPLQTMFPGASGTGVSEILFGTAFSDAGTKAILSVSDAQRTASAPNAMISMKIKLSARGFVDFMWITDPEPRPLSETIRRGLADLPETIEGICFIPGDQVGLEAGRLAELIEYFCRHHPDFLIPVREEREAGQAKQDDQALLPEIGPGAVKSQGINGSPVFFHRKYLKELRSLKGEQGGRVILNQYRERWHTYPVPASFLEDVDTPQDYQRLNEKRRG